MIPLAQTLQLALQHHQAGNAQQAEALYRQVLQADPNQPEAWNRLGVLAWQHGRPDLALDYLRQAATLVPTNPTYHFNLGVAYQSVGQFAEGIASLQQAVRLQPDWAEAHFNLANIYKAQKLWEEAKAAYRRALQFNPNLAEAHNNLGAIYSTLLQPAEAVACYQETVRIKPTAYEAYHNMGAALFQLGRLDEAEAAYRRCLELQPDLVSAHFGLGLTLLLKGDYLRGWEEYEWRWQLPGNPPSRLSKPLWDGSPLAGQTLLVYAEQGLGDTLQFLRFLPLLKQQGCRLLFQVFPVLHQLLRQCSWIDQLLSPGTIEQPYDVHCPLLSVPRLLGTTLATIPTQVPYLTADPALVEHWQRELAQVPGFKIGIVWQGDPKLIEDKQRSIPLRYFEPLARIEGVRLISLQKGFGAEQVAQVADRFPVTVLPLDEGAGPFMDTAAVMKNLDLVIGADTALIHLAGALGVPTWLALSLFPYDWRWQLGRDDSPWYPTLRIFRQVELANWGEVFERMTAALYQCLGRPQPAPPILVPMAPGELIDKITILEIKRERITDLAKRHHVLIELAALNEVRAQALRPSTVLEEYTAELKKVNEVLWQVEDALRDCERRQDFGPQFIELARTVYITNDRRAAIKRQINELLGSRFREEKSYNDHTTDKSLPRGQGP